jgi:hypothetical protein
MGVFSMRIRVIVFGVIIAVVLAVVTWAIGIALTGGLYIIRELWGAAVKTYVVYRICDITRRQVPIVTLAERRQQERKDNQADMMRLAERLCAGAAGPFNYLIVASEKWTTWTGQGGATTSGQYPGRSDIRPEIVRKDFRCLGKKLPSRVL